MPDPVLVRGTLDISMLTMRSPMRRFEITRWLGERFAGTTG
jgi:hypothetical protein